MRDEWTGLLDKDEEVLWQGAPKVRVRIEWDSPMHPFFFLFFTGFSVFWMVGASKGPGPFWMFGLIFFGVGIYNLVLVHFWKANVRRNTHYTLTNKRAFIATKSAWKGKQLQSYPIRSDTTLGLSEGDLTTITFATTTKVVNRQTVQVDVGFEDIEDGRDVYAMIRQIQEQGE